MATHSHQRLQYRRSYRWVVCLLLFLATSINYMDRSVLGILAHTLDVLHWSEEKYANIVLAFTLAYGIGYPASLAGFHLLTRGVQIPRIEEA